jgi:hypothetical protein
VSDIADLAQRFKDPNHPEYLLKDSEERKGWDRLKPNSGEQVPMDGLALYYKEIWDLI